MVGVLLGKEKKDRQLEGAKGALQLEEGEEEKASEETIRVRIVISI